MSLARVLNTEFTIYQRDVSGTWCGRRWRGCRRRLSWSRCRGGSCGRRASASAAACPQASALVTQNVDLAVSVTQTLRTKDEVTSGAPDAQHVVTSAVLLSEL